MARKGFVVFILVLGFISSFAQNKPGNAYKDGKGIFFKISGNGLKEPSYILGSMHTIPGDFVWRLPQFENIIGSVKQIACEKKTLEFYKGIANELGPESAEVDTALFKVLIEKYTVSNGMVESFYNKLPKDQQDKCKDILVNVFGYKDPKYWHSALIFTKIPQRSRKMLSHFFETENLHCIDTPIDAYIYDSIANNKNLPVYELDEDNVLGIKETAISTLKSLFNNDISQEQVTEITVKYLELVAGILASTAQNYKCYLEQDCKPLIAATNNNIGFETQFLKERNNLWMKKIPSLIQKEPTFIVVGLLHLFDTTNSTGILHQLENKGYKIERVE